MHFFRYHPFSKYDRRASAMRPRYYSAFKKWLQEKVIKKHMECFDQQTLFSIDLLEAMCFLRSSWDSIFSTVIKNGFKHHGFSKEDVTKLIKPK